MFVHHLMARRVKAWLLRTSPRAHVFRLRVFVSSLCYLPEGSRGHRLSGGQVSESSRFTTTASLVCSTSKLVARASRSKNASGSRRPKASALEEMREFRRKLSGSAPPRIVMAVKGGMACPQFESLGGETSQGPEYWFLSCGILYFAAMELGSPSCPHGRIHHPARTGSLAIGFDLHTDPSTTRHNKCESRFHPVTTAV